MQLTQVFVFAATIVASVNALATPVHGVRTYRHSAVAKARAPEPAVSHVSKRGLKKRCKPRTNTSKLILPSGVGNVGNAPETSSVVEVSSTPAPAPSSSSEPAPSSSSEASTSKAVPSTSQAPAPSSSSKASTSKAAPSTSQAPSSTPAPAPSPSSKPAPSSSSQASTSKAAPSTSQAPAPAPTTSQAPAPAPTTSSKASTSKKPTSTSQAPQPTQGSGSSNNSGLGQYAGTLTGQGTWYNTGLTACGVNNNDGEYIAAVSHLLFDTFPGYNGVNPNNNPICGRKASVTYQGKTITVTITDRCEACKIYDLDFTPTAFQNLASLGAGRIDGVSWKFI